MASAVAFASGQPSGVQRRWWADTIWASAANLAQAAGPFLALLLLTRWHGLEAAGQFAYAQAVTAPLAQILNLQLKALILTHSQQELSLSLASSLRAASSIPGVVLCVGLGLWVTPLAGVWMLARLVDSWAEIFQAQDQRHNRMAHAAASVAMRAIFLVICIAVVSDSLEAGILYSVLSLLALLAFDWRREPLRLELNPRALYPVFRRGSMLGLILCLQAASASLPRIVLEHSTDASTLGLFATLSVLVQSGNLLASAFGQGLLPSLGSASRRQILFWAALPLSVAAFALLVEQWAQTTVFDLFHIASTPAARELLLSLGLAQLIVWPSAMIGYALTAKRLYRELLWVGGAILATSIISSLVLIPRWGASGAAIAMTLSAGATLAVSFWFLLQQEPSR